MPHRDASLLRRATLIAAGGAALAAALVAPSSATTPVAGGADRMTATVLFTRPAGGAVDLGRNVRWDTAEAPPSPVCDATLPICVHWTDSGEHAPPAVDNDLSGVPDQVESTLATATTAWSALVDAAGFRAPLPDGRSRQDGGDNRFDIYLADTGSRGLSGYTSSDDPRLSERSTYRYRDVSAFVVLDNDFRAGQFARGTTLDNLKAATAHELMHAIELAYDYREDGWLAESTAAWAEDEVFDDVNLNVLYLQNSSLSAPGTPVDFGRGGHQFGSWVFLRYLSERFGGDVVADIWRLADDSPQQVSSHESDTYSMRAVRRSVARQGRDFERVFADFMTGNLKPVDTYDEGSSYVVPFSPRLALNAHGEDTGWLGTTVDHLAATYVTFVPGDNAPAGRRLELRVDGPPRGFAPAATVVVRFTSGDSATSRIALSKRGNGEIRVPFGRGAVATVDVALINTSTRYEHCITGSTTYSCRGVPKDDNRLYKVRARVL